MPNTYLMDLDRAKQLEPISDEELQRGMPKRRIGFAWWAVIALIGVIGVPLGGYISWTRVAEQEFNRRIAELEAENYPTSVQGLQRFYDAPAADRDATHLWRSVLALVETKEFEADAQGIPFVDHSASVWQNVGDEVFTKAEEFLEKYSDQLALLHDAAELGGQARYPIEFEDGYLCLLPHVQQMHVVTGLLRLEAHVTANAGDSAGVTRSIQTALTAAQSLSREPIIVSQMTRVMQLERILETIEDLLVRIDFADAELAAVQESMRGFHLRESFRRAFIGEQALTIVSFRQANAEDLQQMGEFGAGRAIRYPAWLLAGLGTRNDDLVMYTSLMQEIIAATERPWPDAIDAVESVTNRATAITSSNVGELRYAVTHISLSSPSFPTITVRKAASGEAMLKCADTLIGARRFELRHGMLPTSLNELVPEFLEAVPTDPFTPGQTLRTMIDDANFSVYSVGCNQKDDNGISGPDGNSDEPADIVLGFKRSPSE